MPTVLLAYYCTLILIASIVGGMVPVWFQLTHRWMQFAVSFVAGVMLGIGVLHMLPHAITDAATAAQLLAVPEPAEAPISIASIYAETARWITVSLLAGMLAMFFIERFFSYHHHDVADGSDIPNDSAHDHNGPGHNHSHGEIHGHSQHDMSWSGAAFGLALHSVLNGVALAAAVQHGHGQWLAGFGTFLVIVLHKPFDAMTISMLMDRGGWSQAWRNTINGLFSLCIPLGVLVFYFGFLSESTRADNAMQQWWLACALAFSAGTFLCISLSDLLPELQFHSHDRLKLSIALVFGLFVAHAAAWMESKTHRSHTSTAPPASRADVVIPHPTWLI